jgi:integrase
MPRLYNELSDLKVKAAKEPGRYPDGRGLVLQVTVGADKVVRRSWLLRVNVPGGKKREMGLGAYPTIDLAMARARAEEARRLAASHIDPIEHREALKKEQRKKDARAITFKQAAEAYIQITEPSWENEKHRDQWRSTLEDYVYPVFGSRPVNSIDIDDITEVLEPIWHTKTETAKRVQGRIERILDWSKVKRYRTGDNPARWKGHLSNVFPPRGKVQKVEHHKSLPYEKLPDFMVRLRARSSLSARALELVILTGGRTSEIVNASWEEIDLQKRIWTIPAGRIKTRKEHRVPLSDASMQLLGGLAETFGPKGWLFPSMIHRGRPLSTGAMAGLLGKQMKQTDATVHGFRSTFRTWVAEQTDHWPDIAETALSHSVGSKVERAYQRRDLLEKRRELMAAWADYCGSASPPTKKSNRKKR